MLDDHAPVDAPVSTALTASTDTEDGGVDRAGRAAKLMHEVCGVGVGGRGFKVASPRVL